MSMAMKDSEIPWIGEIPKDWDVVPHKQVMSKLKEIQETYNGEDIISLTMKGVVVRNLDNGGKIPMSFDGYQKVYPDNLLLCLFDIDVTPRCVGLIKNRGVTSPAYSQFILKKNRDSHYYDYLLRYIDDNKCFLHLSKNLRNSLTESDLGQIPTVVAPKSEQRVIADFLDVKCAEVDELIALQEKMIDELKVYKQSVITEAVTKGLNSDAPLKDSGIEWIGQIPEHWEAVQFKRCMRIYNGKDYKDIEAAEGYPVIGSGGVFARASNYIYDGEVLLLGRKGTINKPLHYIGKFWTVDTMFYAIIQKTNNCRYFYYQAHTFPYEMYSTATALPSMTSTALANNIVCNPPDGEQQQIADYLDTKCAEIDEMTSIKQQKIEQLKEYKKSIIYEYVTGKKQVIF